jgi:hypothetical protein
VSSATGRASGTPISATSRRSGGARSQSTGAATSGSTRSLRLRRVQRGAHERQSTRQDRARHAGRRRPRGGGRARLPEKHGHHTGSSRRERDKCSSSTRPRRRRLAVTDVAPTPGGSFSVDVRAIDLHPRPARNPSSLQTLGWWSVRPRARGLHALRSGTCRWSATVRSVAPPSAPVTHCRTRRVGGSRAARLRPRRGPSVRGRGSGSSPSETPIPATSSSKRGKRRRRRVRTY